MSAEPPAEPVADDSDAAPEPADGPEPSDDGDRAQPVDGADGQPAGRRSSGRRWGAILLVAGIAVLVLGSAITVGAVAINRKDANRPNVLVIMTDDQTLEEMRVMPRTRRLIGDEGTTFDSYYVSFPVCCPSRATYYSGQYAHNNDIRDNVPPLGGAEKYLKKGADQSLSVWLQAAGYHTASVGKYLNGWGENGKIQPPPGWDHWFGLIDPTTYNYFNYSVSVNGQRYDYGTKPEDYQTDVLGQEVVNTITRFGQDGGPWYVSFTPLAPHVGGREGSKEVWSTAVPAPRHDGAYANEPLPTSPSYNEADVSKKPLFIRQLGQFDANAASAILGNYRKELESLLAVDESVEHIVNALRDTGQLDNTVILFTSDNGLFHGEHRNVLGKVQLYEESSHVPLLVRGGPFPAGAKASQTVANVDLAPTILALAGVKATHPLDGRNLAPLATNPEDGKDRAVLLENWNGFTEASSQAIRGGRWFYAEHPNDEKELYDVQTDPYQLHNLADDPAFAPVVQALAPRLAALRTCAGATCEGSDASLGR